MKPFIDIVEYLRGGSYIIENTEKLFLYEFLEKKMASYLKKYKVLGRFGNCQIINRTPEENFCQNVWVDY